MGRGIDGLIEAVATNGESDAVDLRCFRSDGGEVSDIGDFLESYDLFVCNEEDGVGASNVITNTLFKVVKDVIICTSPNVLIGSFGKVAVSEALSSGGVNDDIGTVVV